MGSCADGICSSIQTRRTTVYEGGNGNSWRDVYDYSGKQWDPESCSSGDQEGEAPESCGGHSLNWWKNQEASSVYAEPGVQVYEDPDAQSSPIGPYPLPAAYVGTCGVTAGGGQLSAPAGTPGTNSAGQLSASTGC